MRVLTIVGARPQFIKAAAVSRPLRERHIEVLLHTGQHYDDAMSGQFFRELNVPPPDIELGVGSGSHAEQTAGMLVGIERAIGETRPDAVLVYGDTNSTLAGALAAAKAQVPIAHVEAGLRSNNRRMPEEINRIVTDRLSGLLFCPSERAARNLRREGVTAGVHVVGDVMADVLERVGARADDVCVRFGLAPGQYYLATIHRAENADDPRRLAGILEALSGLALPVLLPVHPRVRAVLDASHHQLAPGIRAVEPVGYASMVGLIRQARAVLTDSGGLQKEAYWLGVPCVTLRDETEWVETVEAGWNVLAGADPGRIIAAATAASRPTHHPVLYGDGQAGQRIASLMGSLS